MSRRCVVSVASRVRCNELRFTLYSVSTRVYFLYCFLVDDPSRDSERSRADSATCQNFPRFLGLPTDGT